MRQLAYGLFHHEDDAGRALQALLDADFPADDLVVLTHEGNRVTPVHVAHRARVARGATVGSMLGALVGAVAVPVLGVLPGPPGALIVEGLLGGAAVGLALGAVAGLGFWQERLDAKRGALEGRAVLVGVTTEAHAAQAQEVLRRAGADLVHLRPRQDAEEELRSADPRWVPPPLRSDFG